MAADGLTRVRLGFLLSVGEDKRFSFRSGFDFAQSEHTDGHGVPYRIFEV